MNRRLLAVSVLAMVAILANAHDLDVTTIRLVDAATKTRLTLETPLSRLVRDANLGDQPNPAELDAVIRSRVRLTRAGNPESLPAFADLDIDGERDVVRWEAELSSDASSIEVAQPFDTSTSAARTMVIKSDSTEVVGQGKVRRPALELFTAGMSHVLSGLDHVLFVIGMTMLVGTLGGVVRVLTAFTVAHCVSLTCAALGWTPLGPQIVEPLIALSIVALAVEGLVFGRTRPDRERWHWAMALVFGLIHGFGFAGGLSALGLTRDELPRQLFGFSVGIEVAQVILAATTVLAMAVLGRVSFLSVKRISIAACLALGMAGSFWFAERLV